MVKTLTKEGRRKKDDKRFLRLCFFNTLTAIMNTYQLAQSSVLLHVRLILIKYVTQTGSHERVTHQKTVHFVPELIIYPLLANRSRAPLSKLTLLPHTLVLFLAD